MQFNSGKLVRIFALLPLYIHLFLFRSSKDLCTWSSCFWQNDSCKCAAFGFIIHLPLYFLLHSALVKMFFWDKNVQNHLSDGRAQGQWKGGFPRDTPVYLLHCKLHGNVGVSSVRTHSGTGSDNATELFLPCFPSLLAGLIKPGEVL